MAGYAVVMLVAGGAAVAWGIALRGKTRRLHDHEGDAIMRQLDVRVPDTDAKAFGTFLVVAGVVMILSAFF